MTAQTATTTHNLRTLAQTLRFANVAVDVAMTLGVAGISPWRLEVSASVVYGGDFSVDVQLDGEDVVGVDELAARLPGDWDHEDTEVAGAGNYGKRGLARFGGESVSLLVFTGRPAAAAVTAERVLGGAL